MKDAKKQIEKRKRGQQNPLPPLPSPQLIYKLCHGRGILIYIPPNLQQKIQTNKDFSA